ncbi:MAG: glycoside hydrolase family 3 C-terminal domain-containing protein [Oscillospiraceae bacterium]|nr:glycoside hydrolase family 3 C-terminal domain-containing protein [Oscillospiraceae bacterium]
MDKSKLEALLKDMSLTEKIEQLVQLHGNFFGGGEKLTGPEAEFDLPEDFPYRTGSVLGERGAEKLHKLQDEIMAKQPHHIPAVFMTDVIHGYETAFPVPIAIGSSFDPKLAEELASAAALEASAAGIHVTFSPMVDVARDSRWGRCMESTGEDPWLNGQFAAAMVKGFQGDDYGKKGKVASCAKHFAAYGAVQSGRDYNVTEISERTLFEDYLPPYKAAVDAGVSMVMTAFNTIDRVPCTINKRLMRDILRKKWGFEGVLITDYGAINESIIHGASEDKKDAARKAIEAGCDVDMVTDCYARYLEELVNEGTVPESLVDEAVMRLLELKNRLGLFENPYKDGSDESEKKYCFCKEHRELSRKAAEECTVLLKNNGVLPLSGKEKIAIIGALADDKEITGTWALFACKEKTVTLKEAFEQLYPKADITYVISDSDTESAVSAAKAADVVILALGENENYTGESRSRADISLFKEQKELFSKVYEANKNIVTVLFGGRPLAVPDEAEKSAAMLEAWLPGSCGCYAVADILFGKVNPSGRLSMSMPYCSGQLPISYSAYSTGRPKPDGAKGFIPFLSNYMDVPNVPLYPFGHGLSYSDIEYSAVRLDKAEMTADDKITASVTVKNNGSMPAWEAVQLYIRDIKASVVRPMKQLKGLQKISLAPNEEKTVSFEISGEMLSFYDINMEFKPEKGKFTLWIGGSSLTENSADFELI